MIFLNEKGGGGGGRGFKFQDLKGEQGKRMTGLQCTACHVTGLQWKVYSAYHEQKEAEGERLIDAAWSPRIFISATFLYPPSISLSIFLSLFSLCRPTSLSLPPLGGIQRDFELGRHNGMLLHRFGEGGAHTRRYTTRHSHTWTLTQHLDNPIPGHSSITQTLPYLDTPTTPRHSHTRTLL